MKNEENLSQIFEDSPHDMKKTPSKARNIFDDKIMQCVGSNPAYQYCVQEGCHKTAVICQSEQCACQLQHQNCETFLKVNKFHTNINDKIIQNTSAIIDQIDQEVKKISDRTSLMLEEYTEMFKTFGLNKNDENIVDQIFNHFGQKKNEKQQHFLTGNLFFKHRESYKESSKKWFKQSLEKYKKVFQQAKRDVLPMFDYISNILTYFHVKHRQNYESHHCFYDSVIFEKPGDKIFGSSQSSAKYLLDTLDKSMKVESFKKIFSYEYKSEHKSEIFQKEQLLKRIQKRENLLFLVKNNHGHRFGAFTQRKLSQKIMSIFGIKDHEKKLSIEFSLTYEYSEQSSCTQSGFIYSPQSSKLEFVSSTLYNPLSKLSITFEKNGMDAELFLKETVHPTKRDNYNRPYSMSYQEIHGRNKVGQPNRISVLMLEIYQVCRKDVLPKKQIKEIMEFKANKSEGKANKSEPSQVIQKEKNQSIFDTTPSKAEGLFGKPASQASSLFQTKQHQPSIFANNK